MARLKPSYAHRLAETSVSCLPEEAYSVCLVVQVFWNSSIAMRASRRLPNGEPTAPHVSRLLHEVCVSRRGSLERNHQNGLRKTELTRNRATPKPVAQHWHSKTSRLDLLAQLPSLVSFYRSAFLPSMILASGVSVGNWKATARLQDIMRRSCLS
jgi:hypothetical protein